MDNDEVQAKRQIRTSRIKKSIQRTLTTAKYESIVIHTEIDEEIQWSSLEEREKKSRNWDAFLIQDFKKTHDEVLKELQLSHKTAYFKNNLADKDHRADVGISHELDDLDILR